MNKSADNILVIKLGALGDFIQALGPMAAIRNHHPGAHITLLTTAPFENFAKSCSYFDDIWIDTKPKIFNISGWMSLKQKLNSSKFTRVYDLQNNDRTSFYFRLFGMSKPQWVGTAKGTSHRNASPERTGGHAFDGHAQTLALAGIKNVQVDKMEWLDGPLSSFSLKKPFVILVPGSAPEHPQKRWPALKYARLAVLLNQWGFQPVCIGTAAEEEAAQEIKLACPETLDLTGQTSLAQVAALARNAAAAVGNDTGPMHIIAATSCPVVALFSAHSNPVRHAPKGNNVQIVRQDNLHDLSPEDVLKFIKPRHEPALKSALKH